MLRLLLMRSCCLGRHVVRVALSSGMLLGVGVRVVGVGVALWSPLMMGRHVVTSVPMPTMGRGCRQAQVSLRQVGVELGSVMVLLLLLLLLAMVGR